MLKFKRKKTPGFKNRKVRKYVKPKNAIMCLNELRNGLKFKYEQGSFTSLDFFMTVEVILILLIMPILAVHSDPSHGKKSIFDYHGTFRIVVLLKLNRFSESVQKELRVYHFSFVFSAIMKLNVLFSLLN